jgi:hypothetical protein
MIEFLDTQRLPTRITFAAGLGAQPASITPLLVPDPNGYLSTGHAMEILISNMQSAAQIGSVEQSDEPLSIEIEIHYNNADLQSLLDAGDLELLWESPDGWVDATTTCSEESIADNNVQQQVITVTVCELGVFGLFAPISRLYFPIMASDQ